VLKVSASSGAQFPSSPQEPVTRSDSPSEVSRLPNLFVSAIVVDSWVKQKQGHGTVVVASNVPGCWSVVAAFGPELMLSVAPLKNNLWVAGNDYEVKVPNCRIEVCDTSLSLSTTSNITHTAWSA